MPSRITQLFNSRASAVALACAVAAAAGVPASAENPDLSDLVREDYCFLGKSLLGRGNEITGYMASLFRRAEVSLTEQNHKFSLDTFNICIGTGTSSGSPEKLGSYDWESDNFWMNTSRKVGGYDVDDALRVLIIRHEMQHRSQGMKEIDPMAEDLNMRGADRVILFFAAEMDARVESVAFAQRKKQQGQNDYYHELVKLRALKPVVGAYDRSLLSNPGDELAAMRAAAHAVLEQGDLQKKYAPLMEKYRGEGLFPAFNPALPEHSLGDGVFMALGERPGGNYMDEGLIRALRQSDHPESTPGAPQPLSGPR